MISTTGLGFCLRLIGKIQKRDKNGNMKKKEQEFRMGLKQFSFFIKLLLTKNLNGNLHKTAVDKES